jgi:hypothetical protein
MLEKQQADIFPHFLLNPAKRVLVWVPVDEK